MKHISDGKEHSTTETHDTLAWQFGLTDEEVNQYLPSGNQKTFYNRVFWAKAHLKMAGLLENTKRGHFKITDRGKQALATNPVVLNLKFLKQYPDYLENAGRTKGDDKNNQQDNEIESEATATPEEILEINYIQIRNSLS